MNESEPLDSENQTSEKDGNQTQGNGEERDFEVQGCPPWQLSRSIRSSSQQSSGVQWERHLITDYDLLESIRSMNFVLADLRSIDRIDKIEELNRSAAFEQINQCLLCDICGSVLTNPYTSTVCLHSYCRSCIEEKLDDQDDGDAVCPVNECGFQSLDGFQATCLGPDPLSSDNGRVKKDSILMTLCHKLLGKDVFLTETEDISEGQEEDSVESFERESEQHVPHIQIDKTMIQDRGIMNLIGIVGSRPIKPVENTDSIKGVEPEKAQENETQYMTLALFYDCENTSEEKLSYNYFYVPSKLSLAEFSSYIAQRFDLANLSFWCHGLHIDDMNLTLIEVSDEYWMPHTHQEEEIFTLRYTTHTP